MNLNLKEIYTYLLESFRELNTLLEDERIVLIENKYEELVKLVDEKTLISKKISLLEEKRIILSAGDSVDVIVEKGLVSKEDIEEIKKLVREIKEKNETNRMLTKQSLNYIRAIKFALTPSENRVTTYGNQGKIGESSADSIFSTKL